MVPGHNEWRHSLSVKFSDTVNVRDQWLLKLTKYLTKIVGKSFKKTASKVEMHCPSSLDRPNQFITNRFSLILDFPMFLPSAFFIPSQSMPFHKSLPQDTIFHLGSKIQGKLFSERKCSQMNSGELSVGLCFHGGPAEGRRGSRQGEWLFLFQNKRKTTTCRQTTSYQKNPSVWEGGLQKVCVFGREGWVPQSQSRCNEKIQQCGDEMICHPACCCTSCMKM